MSCSSISSWGTDCDKGRAGGAQASSKEQGLVCVLHQGLALKMATVLSGTETDSLGKQSAGEELREEGRVLGGGEGRHRGNRGAQGGRKHVVN